MLHPTMKSMLQLSVALMVSLNVCTAAALETDSKQPLSKSEKASDPKDLESCRYFLANHSGVGSTDIYELILDEENLHANMVFIKTINQRVSIACNVDEQRLYLIRETSPLYQTLDISVPNGDLGFSLIVATGASGFSGATCAENGELFAASEASNKVYRYNPMTETTQQFASAQIEGGDIAFGADGHLYLASASPSMAYEVVSGAPNINLGALPQGSTGLALLGDGNFLLSLAGDSLLYVGDNMADFQDITYTLKLEGETFVHSAGDMASGCDLEGAGIAKPSFQEIVTPQVRVVPSLNDGNANVYFQPARMGHVRLEIFDMQGRSVEVLLDTVTDSNQAYTLNFDGSHLPNGVYICQYSANGTKVVEKFMIAK